MSSYDVKKQFENLKDMQMDVLIHPENDLAYLDPIFNSKEFKDSDIKIMRSALSKILSNKSLSENKKNELINNNWKVNFTQKPPSPHEFLSSKWLGPAGEEMFGYKKDVFYRFLDPYEPFRNLILYLPIGWGKSTFALVLLLYIATHIYIMRQPRQFLGIQKSSYLVIAIIAFTQEKANEIISQPLKDVIQGSSRFEKCRTTEALERSIVNGDPNKIYWSEVRDGSVARIGNLRFKQISSIANLLGLSVLSAIATELTFFKEKGWPEARIMKLYNSLKGRINSRFPNNYYARSILDSSPDSLDNEIDKWIIEEAKKDPTNYLVRGTKWEYQPWLFPEWERTKETFPVYKGTASSSPKILTEDIRYQYDETMIIDFPIDDFLKQRAIDDLSQTLKDFAGEPSSAKDRLIQNHQLIEGIFSDQLLNELTYIHAPASYPPEDFLWNMFKDKYFIKVGDQYQFYRHPSVKRYISIDQSEKNGWTGIAMSHVEINTKGELIYITDFAITIVPGPKEERINLEAIKYFIRDLRKHGGIRIGKVSLDQFQSSSTIQFLDRIGIDAIRESVDSTTEPYLEYISKMTRGCVKMGKSIVMKNNLKSLIMSETKIKKKKKIDHVAGDLDITLNNNWDTSRLGFFGKDLSDAVVASVYLADKFGSKNPNVFYKEIGGTKREIHSNMKEELKKDVKKIFENSSINKFIKLK